MLAIDLDSPEPLYEQIVRGLRRAIAGGAVRVGDRLPSVRQLAGDLSVNLNTVARAYRSLEDDGLVRVRHGQGAVVVSGQVPDAVRPESLSGLEASLAQAFAEAILGGLSPADLRRVTERALRRAESVPGRVS